jgi:diguanylate cyclase (GGDEF)-like protein
MRERKTIIDPIDPQGNPKDKHPSLIVLAGRDFGRQYFLHRGETVIGRDEECAVRLNDARVSRKHAKITGDPGHQSGPYFKIIDLDSSNGTFLNDQRIKEAVLTDGDRIHIGYTVFKYAIRDIVEVEYEDRIFRMATTDSLTGLLSRDYFLQQYSDIFHRSERYRRPFAVMMIDVDDFKAVNDEHGHSMGDRVLEEIGQLIMDVVRHEDCAARYGGEEFIVLLPETISEKARHPAERLRKKLESHRFNSGNKQFTVTVSIGIAGYPEHASTMSELVENADAALYEAKKSGKNAVRMLRHDT